MAEIGVTYHGNLHCTVTGGPAAAMLTTDGPADLGGRAESFSPTDLVAAALGTCILSTMAIVARRQNVDLAGAKATVSKEMAGPPDRRIGRLAVTIHVPAGVPPEHRQRIENAARHCPVHHSLRADVETVVAVVWE